ncbi:hypothetical protein C1S82_01045 [Mycolicibacterium cosmeticum]|uniref:site-specific DNA-methyltransferase (adenine-specific) n=1 Tax=Mycolicibacterium cosmeticum TaxID=258533 RepID=W9AXP8_MYCCO|nr:DNA methyltransferase [Mycolicibacterium cosmeticum]TLH81346.1 hypothetical protein C1S82_01045 [Mycolicibacterium cosmeticum]CDO10564.1 DNA methylase [Mycolicibacterium cosmeticum]
MAEAPKEIWDLVERYERERRAFESGSYGEADTRKEFIEPLFAALGWDVVNRRQYSEAYKDVVNEYSLKIGGSHKAPDYAFRVGGNRVFFVEAKKPSIDISRDSPSAYQLRRYGWTAKLAISVLTNFRHLAIYDCTQQPSDNDRASAARTLLVPWKDLIERWTEVEDLLSNKAVNQGSLQRYFDQASRRRGTSEVDGIFLLQMEQWRIALARNIAKLNPTVSVNELNEAVQQTLDRIVFLRIAEDRGIEPYGDLKDASTSSGVYARLLDIFTAADTRYNSGLFHFKAERDRSSSPDRLTPGLTIEDDVLKDIIGSMYYPTSPYEFSVMPADILGQVYEQFLGKVIRLTDKRAVVVEEKPEIRHAGGVYYTPTYIVEHIVEKTLGPLLEGKTIRAARNIRVLDPACGSGSFLLGAFEYLIRWFTKAHSESGSASSRQVLFKDANGELRLTLEERKRILTSNLFGLDIDRQAVEVTKLSLMLRVLEGETSETINSQLKMFAVERALPDLDKNILCGNSLVDSSVISVVELTPEEEYDLNPFDWAVGFPEAMAAKGFHAVIGNPPYDVIEKDRGEASWPHDKLREYIPSRTDYEAALGGKLNLYRFFLVQSSELVRPDGYMGMIVPMGLAADISTRNTRKHLFTYLRNPTLDCFPQKDNPYRRIFRDAKLSTMVVAGQKSGGKLTAQNQITTRVFPGNDLKDESIDNVLSFGDLQLLNSANAPVPLLAADEWEICRAIHSQPHVRRLSDLGTSYVVTRGEINQTTYGRYIVGAEEKEGYEPLLKGVEVGTFELRDTLSQGQREMLNAKALRKRYPGKTAPLAPRIATQRITGVDERQRLVCAVVSSQMWFADSTNSIVAAEGAPLPLEYLVALLNSDLMQWRFRLTSSNNNVASNELLDLPIAVHDPTSPTEHQLIEKVMKSGNRIAALKAQARAEKTSSGAQRIGRMLESAWVSLDDAVYDLYGLSKRQRNLIERRLGAAPLVAQLTDGDGDM